MRSPLRRLPGLFECDLSVFDYEAYGCEVFDGERAGKWLRGHESGVRGRINSATNPPGIGDL